MLDKRSTSETAKILFIGSLSILALFLGFFTDYWGVADKQWFGNHQRDMENHVIGRMVRSRQDGIFSDGGLMGIGSPDTTLKYFPARPFSNQVTAYVNGQSFGAFRTYNSLIGGQGMLFSIFDKLITLSPQEKLNSFHAFTAMLSAITLTAIILWFYMEFGFTVAIFVIISAVFSQWLVVFGRNLYRSMWAFYLPVVVMMYYLKSRQGQMNFSHSTLGAIVFITVFIKCLFNGYEYITTVLVMMIVPFFYYGLLNRMRLRRFLAGLFTAASSAFLAVLLSFTILCFQVASVRGKFMDGVGHIVYSFEKRTWGNPHDFAPVYTPGLESGPVHVIVTYLEGTFFDANQYLSGSIPFISGDLLKVSYEELLIFFLVMSGLLYFLRSRVSDGNEKRKLLALIFATWFSLLAPLSWFIIFKPHSYVHTHMNFIVWQMPFVFFGFAVSGLVVKIILANHIRWKRMKN